MVELWRNIDGYQNYQVSNLGNVRSMNYRGTGETKQLVPKENNCGRLWVELKGKPFLIHRLVAMAFLPNENNFPQINHIDENPKNNRVDNLEWCTGEYNRKAFLNNHKGGRAKKNVIPVNQIDLCGNIVRQWEDSRTIANETGMSQWSITQCCDGKRNTAYGFRWQYAI